MTADSPTAEVRNLRGTDVNSLLRMYDAATAYLARSPSPRERARADRTKERIAQELRKRNVSP